MINKTFFTCFFMVFRI